MTRASRYRTFGREVDGFIVMRAGFPADRVAVTFSSRGRMAAEQCAQAVTVLSAAGFVARERKRNGLGGDYWLDVEAVS